jgi:hypothetical protein
MSDENEDWSLEQRVHLFGPGIFMQIVCGFGETLVPGLDCSIYEGRDIKEQITIRGQPIPRWRHTYLPSKFDGRSSCHRFF